MSPRRSQEAQNEAQRAAQNSGEISNSGAKISHFGPPGGPWATQGRPRGPQTGPEGRWEPRKPRILRGFRVVRDFRGRRNPRKIRGLGGPDPRFPRFGYDFR